MVIASPGIWVDVAAGSTGCFLVDLFDWCDFVINLCGLCASCVSGRCFLVGVAAQLAAEIRSGLGDFKAPPAGSVVLLGFCGRLGGG